jgi:hypothetical protein
LIKRVRCGIIRYVGIAGGATLAQLFDRRQGPDTNIKQDMWNEKDYSHEGLGKIMKELNGDHLTKITQPPADL